MPRPPSASDAATAKRMRSVRQRDTAPELAVRRIAYALGLRYRTHNRDLPGSPDLANRRRSWAVFVHGCFWHAHDGCPKATVPKRNSRFWKSKLAGNVARDERKTDELRALGYQVVVIWECEVAAPRKVERRLALLKACTG